MGYLIIYGLFMETNSIGKDLKYPFKGLFFTIWVISSVLLTALDCVIIPLMRHYPVRNMNVFLEIIIIFGFISAILTFTNNKINFVILDKNKITIRSFYFFSKSVLLGSLKKQVKYKKFLWIKCYVLDSGEHTWWIPCTIDSEKYLKNLGLDILG